MPDSYEIATPKPAALIESLRSIGYDLPTAIADIVDNSISANAKSIDITFHWSGAQSWICIVDDGDGMSELKLFEAMRPGSQNPLEKRSRGDLGRFGLGLKTASFSQARRLTVASRLPGDTINAREWDLDYVEKINEWRLLIEPTADSPLWLEPLESRVSGTAVLWTNLDRLTLGEQVVDAAAHARFNDAIDHVRSYLGLIFHRFLEDRTLKISINNIPVEPWNPFFENHPATYRTPVESIPFGNSALEFRGYILPHKDKLTNQEFKLLGGLNGWNAHQGFYIYRNRRLLVFGDWLRLGAPSVWTRDEQYKLARIRLDISNDADSDWQLDVKKSRARPPALIRERLTDLAAKIRLQARSVFAHRGQYGPRAPAPQELERPWNSGVRNGKRVYVINRQHPMVQMILSASNNKGEIDALLRLLEETVPVEQIWLDTAEQTNDRSIPYDGVELTLLRNDLRKVFEALKTSGVDEATARQRLRSIEPFNRYQELIKEL
jgi:anti-sigma regulatory factor (Ser/Thr protein kinase)